MHLGMSGSFRIEAGDDEATWRRSIPSGQDRGARPCGLHLEDGARVVYNDPRRFGSMDLSTSEGLNERPPFAELGVEPLSAEFDAGALAALFAGVRAPIKTALLDQNRIAGLGNIYVCEALHRARLSPPRRRRSLPTPTEADRRARTLAPAIREVLEEAVEAGGSTLRDHRQPDGALGYFQHSLRRLRPRGRRLPAPGLPRDDRRIVQGGRSTFYCPACQK